MDGNWCHFWCHFLRAARPIRSPPVTDAAKRERDFK
jgi:hypothetical protein